MNDVWSLKRLLLFRKHCFTLRPDETIPDTGESARRDRQVIAHEIEFRELGLLGKIRLVGVGDADFASLDRQNFGCIVLHHGIG
jgi:hypothetical protein